MFTFIYKIGFLSLFSILSISCLKAKLLETDPPIITNVTITNESNCDYNDGSIAISATGDNTLEYSIDSGANWQLDSVFNNLSKGNYPIQLRYIDGTFETTSLIYTVNGPTTPQIQGVNAINAQGNCDNGIICINALGNLSAIEYSIDGGATWYNTSCFYGVPSGNYDIVIRNLDETCEVNYELPVPIEIDTPYIEELIYIEPSSANVEDGSITIIASESSNIEYSIDGGINWSTVNVFTNLGNGTYNPAIKYSCNYPSWQQSYWTFPNLEIGDYPIPIVFADTNYINITEITATASPSCLVAETNLYVGTFSNVDSLLYSIDSGLTWQSSSSFPNLPNGFYYLAIKSVDNNISLFLPKYTIYDTMLAPTINAVDINPQNTCNYGSICIEALQHDFNDLNYSIDNGLNWSTSNCFDSLSSGTYDILVQYGAELCQIAFDSSININQNPIDSIEIIDVLYTSPSSANNDGTITIIPSIYTNTMYSIDGGITFADNNVFQNLSAGVYTIKIMGDCSLATDTTTYPTSIILTIPSYIENADIELSSAYDCGNDEVDLSISVQSNFELLSYSIDSGITWQIDSIFENLASGHYYPVIKSETDSFILYTNMISIENINPPVINELQIDNATSCNSEDGSICIIASGIPNNLLEYSINDGLSWSNSNCFSNINAGYYTVKVRYADYSCSISPCSFVKVNSPELPNMIAINSQYSTVGDGTITILSDFEDDDTYSMYTIDGGATYDLDSHYVNLYAGNYLVGSSTIDGNCLAGHFTLNLGDTLDFGTVITSIEETIIQTLICGDSLPTVEIVPTTLSDGQQFSIDSGITWQMSPIFENVTTGNYIPYIRNNNCIPVAGEPFEVENTTFVPLSIDSLIVSTCENSILIEASGNGPLQYSIDGGITFTDNHIFSGLNSGNYTIVIKDNNACSSLAQTINLPEQINLDLNYELGNCNQASTLIANVTGGVYPYSYNWNNGSTTSFINPNETGVYTVTVTDDNNCSMEKNLFVESVSTEALAITIASTNVSCHGAADGMVQALVSGGTAPYTYNWADLSNDINATNIDNITGGTYSLIVTDALGCSLGQAFSINEPAPLQVDINYNSSTATAIAIVSGGTPLYQYSWSNGGTSVLVQNVENPSNLSVNVTDEHSCESSTTWNTTMIEQINFASIKIFPNPTYGQLVLDINFKQSINSQLSLFASNGQSILQQSFNQRTIQTSFDLSNQAEGIYYLEILDTETNQKAIYQIVKL